MFQTESRGKLELPPNRKRFAVKYRLAVNGCRYTKQGERYHLWLVGKLDRQLFGLLPAVLLLADLSLTLQAVA